jgi:RNA recognition motif-containing protein
VVLDIFLPKEQSSGNLKGLAFVEFADEASVAKALEKLNDRELNGRKIHVSQAEEPLQRSPNIKNQGPKSGYSSFKKSKSKGSRRNVRAKKRGG